MQRALTRRPRTARTVHHFRKLFEAHDEDVRPGVGVEIERDGAHANVGRARRALRCRGPRMRFGEHSIAWRKAREVAFRLGPSVAQVNGGNDRAEQSPQSDPFQPFREDRGGILGIGRAASANPDWWTTTPNWSL